MIEFKKPQLSDMEWIKEAMHDSDAMACEYCFGNLYMWTEIYENTVANYNGVFIARDGTDRPMYLYPCGKGDKKAAIEELIKYSANDGWPLELYCLTPKSVRELDSMFPDKFDYIEMREYFDYLYFSEDLGNLAGRKYHAKRNHISYFKKTFNWQYEKITKDNICDCYRMNEEWEKENKEYDDGSLTDELDAITRAFKNFDELGFVGGLIRVDGRVVAYTFGEPINDKVFCTHVEKAFADIRGAYPMINQQFCLNELMGYKYINREDDTGDEGLRQAKQSYYPAILLPKFRAVYKG